MAQKANEAAGEKKRHGLEDEQSLKVEKAERNHEGNRTGKGGSHKMELHQPYKLRGRQAGERAQRKRQRLFIVVGHSVQVFGNRSIELL